MKINFVVYYIYIVVPSVEKSITLQSHNIKIMTLHNTDNICYVGKKKQLNIIATIRPNSTELKTDNTT